MNATQLLWLTIISIINVNLINSQGESEGGSGEGGETGGGGETDDRPNIVIMFADDLGWNDVGYNGASDCYTPYMDSLVENGVVLSHFYTHPKCAPSRAALLTGRHPFRYGFQHDSATSHTIECGLNLTETLFSTVFQEEGYTTYMLGKWHLGFYQWDYTPNYRGFDTFVGYYGNQEDYYTYDYETGNNYGVDFREDTTAYNATITGEYGPDLYLSYMEGWMDDIEIDTDNQPFLWYIAHQSPHSPIDVLQKYIKAINDVKNYTSTPRKNYCSLVYAMDLGVGEIMDTLEENGLWDNTYFFMISDNGPSSGVGSSYPLRGVKATFFEGGIRTPSIVSGGLLPEAMRGTTLYEPTSLVDIFATVCTMAGIDYSDYDLDGIDLFDYVTGASDTLDRDYLLLNVDQVGCSTDDGVCGGIRYGDLKLVYGTALIGGGSDDYYWTISDLDNPSVGENQITVDCDGTRPTVNLSDLSWDCGYNNEPCLFNITADPCEYNDLSGDSDYSGTLAAMIAELTSYYDIQIQPLQLDPDCPTNATASDPSQFGGFWSPWRTSPTGADGTDWEVEDDTSTSGGDSGDSGESGEGTNTSGSDDDTGSGNEDGCSRIMVHFSLMISLISPFLFL